MTGLEKGNTRVGAGLILGSMAIIGLIDNFVVEIGRTGGLWQFHAMRAAMALPVLFFAAFLLRNGFRPRNSRGVVARTVFLASSMLIYFASIPVMPIALVVAGLFTSPVFVLLISHFVFGESIGPVRILAVAMGLLGGLLILDPTGAGFEPMFLAPVAAGFLYALSAVSTRRYCAQEHTLILLFWFFATLGMMGLIGASFMDGDMGAPFHLRGWMWPGQVFLFWTAIQAFGSIAGVFLLTRAYQVASPSYLAVFEYSLLVFASIWAWIIYGDTVTGQALIGMGLIALSGSVIALRSGQS